MYSTEISELAHMDQIKEGYCRSNKNKAAGQILSHYGRKHALGMTLQTLNVLLKPENVVSIEGTGRVTAATPLRILKGWMKNVSRLTELCRIFTINYGNIMEEMIHFTKQTVADGHLLSSNSTELRLLPLEQFTHLEIPVTDFRETDVFQIHRASSTGTMAFPSYCPRNDWVWIHAGEEDSYGDLWGQGLAQLIALFKIRNIFSEAAGVKHLARLHIVNPINSCRYHLASCHIRVGKRRSGR